MVRNKKEEPERRRESEASKWPSGLEGAAGAAQGGLFRPQKEFGFSVTCGGKAWEGFTWKGGLSESSATC